MRGLSKFHQAIMKMSAWEDWRYLEEKYPEVAIPLRPPEGASAKRVDAAIAKVRVAVGDPGDWWLPSLKGGTDRTVEAD